MERILNKFIQWKNDKNKKPLVVKGARQIGKTWAILEFGRLYYKNTAYFNFDENPDLSTIFNVTKNASAIIEQLSFLTDFKIEKHNTLIVFDEIQECPSALNSLKYFCENKREYNIIACGSLLGTLLAEPKSYPVGKVDLLNFYPMSFQEFLMAVDSKLCEYFMQIKKNTKIPEIFHNKLLSKFNEYLIIGGMPECVNSWITEHDASKILAIQNALLQLYENDFSKYNGKINIGRLLLTFRSLPSQLAKDNAKFIYGVIKEGARAREFEEAVEWLVSAGLFNRVYNVSKIEHPLKVFDVLSQFKIYLFETGLLKYMSGVSNKAILLSEDFQFKGALAENFVLQQLNRISNIAKRYYSLAGKEELDFLLQVEDEIIPIEVKAGKNKNAKSFKKYVKEKNPRVAIRFSIMNYMKQENIINIPIYLAERVLDFI